MDEGLKALGSTLRKLRELHRFSQAEVAERLSKSQTEISQLELGQKKHPDLALLCDYSRLYGVTPTDLAVLAGWWEREESTEDPHWPLLREVVRSVPPARQTEILERLLRYAQTQAYLLAAKEPTVVQPRAAS